MGKRLLALGLGAGALAGGTLLAWQVARVARRTAEAGPQATPSASARAPVPLAIAEVVYDGKVGEGWRDWGWGPHDLTAPGPAKIKFAGYGGIVLRHAELRPSFGGLAFRYRTPDPWPEFMTVKLSRTGSSSSDFPTVPVSLAHVAAQPDRWREVLIDWSELDPKNLPFDGLTIAAHSPVSSEWVLLDKIALTKMTGPAKVRDAPTRDVELTIQCDATSMPISPLIYGAAGDDWSSGQAARRLGGNPMSRFNWDDSVWNAGNDWFFENGKVSSVFSGIDAAREQGAAIALVVPMLGWVAKDSSSVGFPRSKFPKQRKFDPNRQDVGDGYAVDGTPLKPGPATETSVAAPPELIGRWIRGLLEHDREKGSRGVAMYILDNEPALWSTTHRDVHPAPLSYDELLDRTIRYATAIRQADPGGMIAGPAEWGWNGYFFSAKDQARDDGRHPDRLAHGDLPLVAWYLKQLAQHDQGSGKRLIDALDLHFYPQAEGLFGTDARVDPDSAELRIRATRALWDPSYKDESWIKEPVRLIPRMKEWVAQNYPGLKTSIGEWSFGADQHISGALATAEALGRFGQQGLDAAFYWGGPSANTGTYWAFRAYRNFDGKGGRFEDLALATRDGDKVSLFASKNESGSHVVAVLVNRDASFATNQRLRLERCGRVLSRRVFNYSAGSASLAEMHASAADPAGHFVMPPYSISVVDFQLERP